MIFLQLYITKNQGNGAISVVLYYTNCLYMRFNASSQQQQTNRIIKQKRRERERATTRRDRYESVDVAQLLLTITPDTRHCLVVIRRVPVRVKHHETIGSDEIETTPTCLATQHEDKISTLTHRHVNNTRSTQCHLNVTLKVVNECFENYHICK